MAAGIPSGLAGSPARRRHGAQVEALARGSRTAAGASGQAGVLSNSPQEVETAPGEARTLVQRAQPPGAAPPAIQTPSHPPDVCSLTVAFSKVFAASLEIKCTGPGKENRESYGTYEGRRERESLGWEKLTGLFPPAWIIQEKCAGSCPRSTQKVKHTGCAWTIRQCETCSDHFHWLHTPGERLRCPNCELPEGCANVRPRPLLCPQLKHIWPYHQRVGLCPAFTGKVFSMQNAWPGHWHLPKAQDGATGVYLVLCIIIWFTKIASEHPPCMGHCACAAEAT
nr:uncharacterized protein LOC110567926 [Aotus nancymaae]